MSYEYLYNPSSPPLKLRGGRVGLLKNMWGNCLAGPELDVAQISCLEPLFARVVTIIASLAGVVFFIMLIVGGFRYLLSGGDPKQAEAAKGTLTAAFLGLVLIVSSFIILRLLSSFTGLNLTQFIIPQF